MLLRFFTLLILIPFATPQLLADQCSDWTQAAYQAYLDKDKNRLHTLHNRMQNSDCLGRDKHYISLNLSRILYEKMPHTKIQQQQSIPPQQVEALKAILAIEPTFWPALLDLGDYYDQQKEFELANSYYNRTLNAINNIQHTPEALLPDNTTIQNIYAKSDNSLAATEGYLALFHDRGTYKTRGINKSRGINPTSRNIPIHFDSGKSYLVGADKKYALELYQEICLNKIPLIFT